MNNGPTNLAASVRQRLLHSRQRGEDFNLTLVRYGTERLLYRLSRSQYADRFVLKGAVLITEWIGESYRATRDVDLLGYGSSSQEELSRVFRDICRLEVEPDGLVFMPDTVTVEEIRGNQEYQGQRVKIRAELAGARIPLQVDIGFGDPVRSGSNEIGLHTLLDCSTPILRAYPPESVVAEKFEALVALGLPNSRLKDFYDVWIMSKRLQFDGPKLARAVRETFQRRKTPVPRETPLGLSEEFATDDSKQAQWRGFLDRHGLTVDTTLEEVIDELHGFLLPPAKSVTEDRSFPHVWPAGGPWENR